jgi:PTS system fructose-specific IIA component/PTS system nitrogen regulatory IIA component
MMFSDFVVAETITADLTSSDKESVLRELIDGLVKSGHIPADQAVSVYQTVLERENLGSTGIGRGIAMPHAKHSSVERPVGTLGVSRKGIDFRALDGESVHLFFLLVSPPDRSADHLSVLDYCSRQLRHDLFCKLLRQAETANEIWQILNEVDESEGRAFA